MKTYKWLAVLVAVCGFLRAAESAVQIDLGGGATIEMVRLPAGEFTQGSPETEEARGPDENARQISIKRDFYIGRTAVTRGQWERFVAETGYRSEAEVGTSGGYGWDGNGLVQKKQFTWRDPGFAQTANHPVCMVTFPDAQAFCKWLERKSKRRTTLPTEAQWEYACRAGTTTPWHSGTSADGVAWHKGNAGNTTHPVDSKPANAWGLSIGGNVSEWCLDWYGPYQSGPLTDPRQDNPNLSDKPRRVLRGGSWNRGASNTRSAARFRSDPRSRNADIGFRVVCSVDVVVPTPPKPLPPPQVEAEPGVTPPLPAPRHEIPPPHSAPDKGIGRPAGGLLGSLLCLAIPIGIVVLLVRIIVGHGRKQNANPFVASLPAAVIPRQRIRKATDGFWIFGDWAAGTPLKVRYMTRGEESVIDLIYQPGPEGQFVFSGRTPDSISVVADGDDLLPPPLTGFPPELPERSFDPLPEAARPPRFPSAY